MASNELVSVMLAQLTGFATDLGHIRAEVSQLRTAHGDYVAKLQQIEVACRALESIVAGALGELRGRNAIADRASLTHVEVRDQAAVVLHNEGEFTSGGTRDGR